MKILEKIGWMLFLVSLILFVVTLIYAIIKYLAETVYDLFMKYHHNLSEVMLYTLLAGLVGFILIRVGAASDNSSDLGPDA